MTIEFRAAAGRVGGRPRADNAGSSESPNLCEDPGQLQCSLAQETKRELPPLN